MKSKSFLFACLATGCLVLRADERKSLHGEETLCHDFEEIYMSCRIDSKIVSLCASGNTSPMNGYVKYRFGTIDNIELEYPTKSIPPSNIFNITEVNAGNDNEVNVYFKIRDFLYTVQKNTRMRLTVSKHGKILSKRVCSEGQYQDFSPRIFRGLPNKKKSSPEDKNSFSK